MNNDDVPGHLWRLAMARFDAWMRLASEERSHWMQRFRDEEPALHARVLSLIAADHQADAQSFLNSASILPAAELEPPDKGLVGELFGPWQIERLIGSGGMGEVWLARRIDGRYDGLVAIKLMRLKSREPGANVRFEREGQLLGRLSHRNIARLIDAGVGSLPLRRGWRGERSDG